MADQIIQKRIPDAAKYGGVAGRAMAATEEGLRRASQNDQDQAAIAGGAGYANQQATAGRPGAVQDQQAANNQAGGANGNQAGAIELARRQAMGQSPSAGAYQLQAGLNQASRQQSAMAAGARGSAALATAGANRAANTSNLQQNAFSGAGMLRSQDMAQGRGMYASLTGQQRSQDQGAIGMANEFGQANASAQDQYRLGMGQAGVAFGGVQNAQQGSDFANTQSAMEIQKAQDDAEQDRQHWLASSRQATVAANNEDH